MNATQIILIVFIVALIIIYPIMIVTKNKKQRQQMQEQTNSLKRGDRVLTASGVYGKVVDLHQDGDKTIVTIETGTEKNRGYISVDSYAIYSIIHEEANLTELPDALPQEEAKVEAKPAEKTEGNPAPEETKEESSSSEADEKESENNKGKKN